ncbi:MAG: 50S ribosomal protein L10 [bacterium]
MNREGKSDIIERLRGQLAGVPAVIVADFKGLTVAETETLRSQFRQLGVNYEVVKNTLIKAAIADTPMQSMGPLFKGNSAIAWHDEDPSAPAKVLRDFVKGRENFKIKGGWLDGRPLDANGIDALASLPGKDELRGKLLSVFGGVPTKFVRTVIAGPQTFLQLLSARRQDLDTAA